VSDPVHIGFLIYPDVTQLDATGLLKGYKAACHWAFREMLPEFGAKPVAERIVKDRNRISGGGVTAGPALRCRDAGKGRRGVRGQGTRNL